MFLVISSQFISTFKTKKIETVKMREDGKDMGISMIIYVVFSLFSIFYLFPQPFQIRFLTRPRLSSSHWLDSAANGPWSGGPSVVAIKKAFMLRAPEGAPAHA